MDISRVSSCTYPMRNQPLDDALRITAEAGFKKVDLWGGMPHFSIDASEYDVDELAALAVKHGIAIANLGTYCGRRFSSDSKDEIEQELRDTKRTIDIAHQLGVRSIRIVPGNGKLETIDQIVPYFKECADYAGSQSVYLGFENHGGPISGNPEACAELSAKVGSEFFGVLYEPCNLMHAGTDYKEAFAIFHQHITHCHIKDGAPGKDGKFQGTMLGEGIIDVKWVIKNLDEAGYTGDFALEYEVSNIEPVETGLRKWFEHYRQLSF